MNSNTEPIEPNKVAKKTGLIAGVRSAITSAIDRLKPNKSKTEESAKTPKKSTMVIEPEKPKVFTSINQIPAGRPFRMRRGKYVRNKDGSIKRIDKPLSKAKGKKLVAFVRKTEGAQAAAMAQVWVNGTREYQRNVLRGRLQKAQ